ncbi:MAG: tRNA epoxyqueuosine(34) reductase QueG [Pirellulaceae bacterium]
MKQLSEQLKLQAQELGFTLTGITPAAAPARLAQLHQWLEAGYAGQMQYIEARREAYCHPTHVLDGCRSLLMLAMPYLTRDDDKSVSDSVVGQARVARYANGEVDYHDVIHTRLKALKAWLLQRQPAALVRGVVDTAPLLEREFAALAGLGWIGKNTLLLNRRYGSYFFLAALLTDLELTADEPYASDHCGTCTACLDQCPTNAFPAAYVLDANRCISYLTIEHRADIPDELAQQLGDWAFGCDVCQEVCPWNRKAEVGVEVVFATRKELESLDVIEILNLDELGFRNRFRHTPLWRSKRRGLLRNAILVAGNQRLQAARPALERLSTDTEPLIQAAATWALCRITPT